MKSNFPYNISRRKFINAFSLGVLFVIPFLQIHKLFINKKNIIISKEGWIFSTEEYDI